MSGFEIDHRAFRNQNVGRLPQHLIREAVQNAFDENPDHVRIEIKAASGRGITVTITDDGPGFTDVKEIWTIFASGKRDDATKRGRLGRGLKELISVSSVAVIETANRKTTFEWTGKTFNRTSKKYDTSGTTVKVTVPSWKKALIPEIEKYLRLFIPLEGTAMIVNGVPNNRPVCEKNIRVSLQTVIYRDDGVPEEKWRMTEIHLLQPVAGQSKWVYEMGIPVELIPEEDGFEWHINIQQRTPLRPERDMLPRSYIRSVYAAIANEMMAELPQEEMTDLWMEEAVGHWSFDKAGQGATYLNRRFGDRAARAVNADPHDRNIRAIEDGVNVIQTQHLSASVRDLAKSFLPSTVEMYPTHFVGVEYIPESEWTSGERLFVEFMQWLAGHLKLANPNVIVMDSPESSCLADSRNSATEIRVNRATLGLQFFDSPRLSNWVPLIIHELAHRTGNGHDSVFWREVERMMGEAVEIIHTEHAEVERLLETEEQEETAELATAETNPEA